MSSVDIVFCQQKSRLDKHQEWFCIPDAHEQSAQMYHNFLESKHRDPLIRLGYRCTVYAFSGVPSHPTSASQDGIPRKGNMGYWVSLPFTALSKFNRPPKTCHPNRTNPKTPIHPIHSDVLLQDPIEECCGIGAVQCNRTFGQLPSFAPKGSREVERS